MRMRSFIISCLLFCNICGLYSQRNANEYYEIGNKILQGDTVGTHAKIFSTQNKKPNKLYFSLIKGDYFFKAGNIKEALNNYSNALVLVDSRPKDTLYALVNYKIGLLNYDNYNYPEALKYFHRAALIYNYRPANLQQARLYMLIGNIHVDLTSKDESIKCYKAALTFYRTIGDMKRMAATQNNIAIVYTQKEDFENAKIYLDSCLDIRMSLVDLYGVGQTLNNYGAMYFKMKNYKDALKNYTEGYEKRIAGKVPKAGLIESQINIGKSYCMLKDNANAIYWLEQGLNEAKLTSNYELQLRATEYLKGLYYEMKEYNKAYIVQELYFVVKDSLYGMGKKNEVENLSLQNQFESKIRQDSLSNVERIRSEKMVAGEKEKRNTILFYTMLSGVIFLSIFVFQLFKSNKSKKRANAIIMQQHNDLDQKQKEIIDSINYAKRIQESLLPSDKYMEKSLNRLKDSKN